MEIIGLKRLNQRLRRLLDQVAGSPSVVVGYGTNYAIYVHENLKARHVVGEAKFLERPARELSDSGELSDLVKQDLRLGRTLEQALLRAGLRLCIAVMNRMTRMIVSQYMIRVALFKGSGNRTVGPSSSPPSRFGFGRPPT